MYVQKDVFFYLDVRVLQETVQILLPKKISLICIYTVKGYDATNRKFKDEVRHEYFGLNTNSLKTGR